MSEPNREVRIARSGSVDLRRVCRALNRGEDLVPATLLALVEGAMSDTPLARVALRRSRPDGAVVDAVLDRASTEPRLLGALAENDRLGEEDRGRVALCAVDLALDGQVPGPVAAAGRAVLERMSRQAFTLPPAVGERVLASVLGDPAAGFRARMRLGELAPFLIGGGRPKRWLALVEQQPGWHELAIALAEHSDLTAEEACRLLDAAGEHMEVRRTLSRRHDLLGDAALRGTLRRHHPDDLTIMARLIPHAATDREASEAVRSALTSLCPEALLSEDPRPEQLLEELASIVHEPGAPALTRAALKPVLLSASPQARRHALALLARLEDEGAIEGRDAAQETS